MATMREKKMIAFTKEIQVPEWEHIAAAAAAAGAGAESRAQEAHTPRRATKAAFRAKFDAILPPHRTYVRLSRTRFLTALTCALLALAALLLGLAVGLSRASSRTGTQNLPLPTNSETHSGELTYYATGLGACGETNRNGDEIVAVSHLLFDAAGSSSSQGGNSNVNPLCGRVLRARRYNEAVGAMRSVDLRVVDRCTGCAPTDLDVTEDVFEQLADVGRGRVDVTWAWL